MFILIETSILRIGTLHFEAFNRMMEEVPILVITLRLNKYYKWRGPTLKAFLI